MSVTPPPSPGETPPRASGPDVDAVHGQYGSVPSAPPDPAWYGWPGLGHDTAHEGSGRSSTPWESGHNPGQTGPASYGTPSWLPYDENQANATPYTTAPGYPDPMRNPPPPGYGDPAPYAPPPGYGDPGQYGAWQGYANAGYSSGGHPGYAMAPAMTAPLPTGMAVAAMVCGITGVVLSLCGGWTIALPIVGIVLGSLGVQKANRGEAGGRGMAVTGIITGAVGAAISVGVILVALIGMVAFR